MQQVTPHGHTKGLVSGTSHKEKPLYSLQKVTGHIDSPNLVFDWLICFHLVTGTSCMSSTTQEWMNKSKNKTRQVFFFMKMVNSHEGSWSPCVCHPLSLTLS